MVRVTGARVYLLPVTNRVPLKFGRETVRHTTCVRVHLDVAGPSGERAAGWGETPMGVQWAWPSPRPYEERHDALVALCAELAAAWAGFGVAGHALAVGAAFLEERLPEITRAFNRGRPDSEPVPRLAALVCNSAFDMALHDAYGRWAGRPVYETYGRDFVGDDLTRWLSPAEGSAVSFAGRFPADFLVPRRDRLPAWHLVGGLDPLEPGDLNGEEPDDGYPVLLRDWIARDGLRCLKVKLRGDDAAWDFSRLCRVGAIAQSAGCDWLSADFNCTVTDPAYVEEVLDRLRTDQPRTYGMLLYVEQPFPYSLEQYPIDVRGVAARKPLFMDESADDWRMVALGRTRGWSGAALKTCKTQTEALLTLCWAKAHGMPLMVQDLTNPMLAQVPHALLAAHADTLMGFETNAMQFYPEASRDEARVHPGLYARRGGVVDLSTVRGPGFGYRIEEIGRPLPEPAVEAGSLAGG